MIADEMGLGKTLQGLAVACYFSSEWPLLIVCPSSLRFSWCVHYAYEYFSYTRSPLKADRSL